METKTEKANYDLNQLLSVVVTIIVLGAVLTFGLDLIVEQQDSYIDGSTACGVNSTGGTGGTILYSGCGSAYNASVSVTESIEKVSNKLPLVVGAIIMAVIIGILIKYFAFNN